MSGEAKHRSRYQLVFREKRGGRFLGEEFYTSKTWAKNRGYRIMREGLFVEDNHPMVVGVFVAPHDLSIELYDLQETRAKEVGDDT
jgi:hypothetical protein